MKTSTPRSFTAVLEPLRNGLGWVIARVPFDPREAWPDRKGLRVRGEIEGFPFRTSLFAEKRGGGGYFILVNRKMQAAADAQVGAMARIRLEPDGEERRAAMPAELIESLKGDRRLRKWFDGLSYSYRKAFCDRVSQPKAAASRKRRAEQLAEQLLLALEGERELPPILAIALQREPLALKGWKSMTAVQRRGHLLGIFYYQGVEARERRTAKAVEHALLVARRGSRTG